MFRNFTLLLAAMTTFSLSCIDRDVTYNGKTVVNPDGSVIRSGRLTIAPLDSLSGSQDSTEADEFYQEHYSSFRSDRYEYHESFSDGILTVSWTGKFAKNEKLQSDYGYGKPEGPSAANDISVAVSNRWIYKEFHYRESYSDPVDIVKYSPIIEKKLSDISESILKDPSMKGLRDRQGAEAILNDLQNKAGVDILKAFIDNPGSLDSLSDQYDNYFPIAGDSLAGLSGVKINPETATKLLKSSYDAAWDTIMTDYPGIFGSYGFTGNKHHFRLEVSLPGCFKGGNADSVYETSAVWNFANTDFFAGEKILEARSRSWNWINVIISIIVLLVILIAIFWRIRRGGKV